MQVVRDDLHRSMPFTITRAEGDGEGDGDGLTFEGYAAVFGEETLIDSWEGTFYESVRRGAFKKSIRENPPIMQFDHGRHPLIGSLPIGVPNDLHEDDRGLFVAARLTDNWLMQPVRDAIRDGAINGMSFRFSVVSEEWRDDNGKLIKSDEELLQLLWRPDERGPLHRTLKEVKVPELGPVVFPAYPGTSASVRSGRLVIDLGRLHEPEQRAQLARAVFLADTAVQSDDDDGGESTPQTSGTPRTTDERSSAGEHAPGTGTPPATDTKSAGEHESATPPTRTDSRAAMRAALRDMREYVNSIKTRSNP